VEFFTYTRNRKPITKIAKLSHDSNAEVNWISQKLLEEKIKMPVDPIHSKEERQVAGRVHGIEMKAEGTVRLKWCYHTRRTPHETVFTITSAYDPPFDAVLGADSIRENKHNRP